MSTSEYDCDQSDLSLTQPGGCMRTDRNCPSNNSVTLDCRNGKLNYVCNTEELIIMKMVTKRSGKQELLGEHNMVWCHSS